MITLNDKKTSVTHDQLLSLGFVFDSDLELYIIPDGWIFETLDIKSFIFDKQKRIRLNIGKTWLELNRRFHIDYYPSNEYGKLLDTRDASKHYSSIVITKSYPYLYHIQSYVLPNIPIYCVETIPPEQVIGYDNSIKLKSNARKNAERWLDEHYSLWRDPLAYWECD